MTTVEVKRCSKCGKELPEGSTARRCPYCGGTLITVYRKKIPAKQGVASFDAERGGARF